MTSLKNIIPVCMALVMASSSIAATKDRRGYIWEYDGGPDVSTDVGRTYAQIFAETPNYRAMGDYLKGRGDKFRWQFGPMFYRGRLGKNQVKVLVIGQEGAQDENVSDRSFTGGTGGRMQSFMDYLGLDRSYLFINTFVYTIKGQYSDYVAVYNPKNKNKLAYRSVLTDELYKLAQTPESPLVQHRHRLMDHIIESNQDSLKLIIAVGGAAQDSLATYLKSKGANCKPKVTDPAKVNKVAYKSVNAGGNRSFFFPVDKSDMRTNLLVKAAGLSGRLDYSDIKIQNELKSHLNDKEVLDNIKVYKDNKLGNGFYSMYQLGANLNSCASSQNLKNVPGLGKNIRYVSLLHPGSNSPRLRKSFQKVLTKIKNWNTQKNGWKLEKDPGIKTQKFDTDYKYTHKAPPRRDFRFGLPEVIGQGTTQTTRRNGGRALEIGSRDKGNYPNLYDVLKGRSVPKRYSNNKVNVPWEPTKENYENFEQGLSEQWMKALLLNEAGKEAINLNEFEGMMAQDKKFGALQIYRGRPEGAKVIVLADQHSHDDLWVGRALMGEEGQRLQNFLNKLNIEDNYFILRTLPFDTMGSSTSDMRTMVSKTQTWRTNIIYKVLDENDVDYVLTLGKWADSEGAKLALGNKTKLISLTKSYAQAFKKVTGKNYRSQVTPINRKDIPYGMRRWTGTGGDRMIRSTGKFEGKLYQMVAPNWSNKMRPKRLSAEEKKGLEAAGLTRK